MTAARHSLPLLVFEAAGCLMAVPASEIGYLEGPDPNPAEHRDASFDLDLYFASGRCNGPWLQWHRGTRSAWLRVRRVIDVIPVTLAALVPMPGLLRAGKRTRAFLAAGLLDGDVFLLLDPGRLKP